MRWQNLSNTDRADPGAALFAADAVRTRTFDTPEFRGVTFHEVNARSVLNRVPGGSRMPFAWTVNPYRGCTHACVYCFARNTHSYLDLDTGHGFDSQIVVKVNAPEVLRRELAAPRWGGEHVAMGTNVDCYQRAEGRYRLMPGILEALVERANPFSILTKGTLILRDLPLLERAAAVTEVGTAVSVGFTDQALWREVEPGTPAPAKRLEVCRTLNDHGVPCGVLMAPVLPFLSDSPEQLHATVRAIAEAGATSVTPLVLHLRPGAREWWFRMLEEHRPYLVDRYRRLYRDGAYAPTWYQRRITRQVHEFAAQYGMGPTARPARADDESPAAEAERRSRGEARRIPPQGRTGQREPGQRESRGGTQLRLI